MSAVFEVEAGDAVLVVLHTTIADNCMLCFRLNKGSNHPRFTSKALETSAGIDIGVDCIEHTNFSWLCRRAASGFRLSQRQNRNAVDSRRSP